MSSVNPSGTQKAKVLITVKTYPNESSSYTELVCTAGLRLDGDKPEWIRLYPLPFRRMDKNEKYKKYDIIEVDVTKTTRDRRPESYRPDIDSIRVIDHLGTEHGWAKRWELFKQLDHETSMCELNRQARTLMGDAQSLALVHPRKILGMSVVPNPAHAEFLEDPSKKVAITDLFGEELRPLEPPMYVLKYKYLCQDEKCRGHNQTVIDWEAGSAAYNFHNKLHYSDQHIQAALRKNFFNNPTADTKDLYFIVGNQWQHPISFMILSLFYPEKATVSKQLAKEAESTLF